MVTACHKQPLDNCNGRYVDALSSMNQKKPSTNLHVQLDAMRKLVRRRALEGRLDDAVALLQKALQLVEHNNIDRSLGQAGQQYTDDVVDLAKQDVDYVEEHASGIEARREHYEFGSEELTDQDRLGNTDKQPEFSGAPSPNVASTHPSDLSSDTIVDEETASSDEVSAPHNEETDFIPDEPATDEFEADTNGFLDTAVSEPRHGTPIIHDFDTIDEYLYDFDETASRDELSTDIQTGGAIDRRIRAMQVASDLGAQYGWEGQEIELLADVFGKYGWNKTRESIERQLRHGLLADELRLAVITRDIWENYSEFSINLDSYGYSYEFLSWPMAVQIVRSFRSYPEPEEIEKFLIDAFCEWSSRRSLMSTYSSYFEYISNRLRFPDPIFLASPSATLDADYDPFEDEFFSGAYAGLNTPEYQDLVRYELIPDIWVDPFAIAIRSKDKDIEDTDGSETEVNDND